jgi:hypothetical protein
MSKAPGKGPTRTPPSRPAQRATGHARAAATRLEAARRRRSRVLTATGAAVLVVVLIVVLVIVKASSSKTIAATPAAPNSLAAAGVLTNLAAIPPAQLAQAATAAGTHIGSPTPITDTSLTDGGKPEVLYVGAEFCPYCAAERWAIVTALLHFGTFTGLGTTHSSASDANPNTPTFSFHGATYSSPYLSFTGVETTTNQRQGNFYAPLDTPTPAQEALVHKYNGGYIPFVDFAGRFVIKSPQYNGQLLAGMTVEQAAAIATDVSTPLGQAIQASAGNVTAVLCQLTGGKPSSVCAAFPTTFGA